MDTHNNFMTQQDTHIEKQQQTVITLQHVQEALKAQQTKAAASSTNPSHFMLHKKIVRELTDFLLSKGVEGSPASLKEAMKNKQLRAEVSGQPSYDYSKSKVTETFLFVPHR